MDDWRDAGCVYKALREAGAAEVLAVTVALAIFSPQKVSR
jgi:hypothetical protein